MIAHESDGRDDRIICGVKQSGKPLALSYGDLSTHVLISGYEGFGKKTLITDIARQHIEHGGGMLFVGNPDSNLKDFATQIGRGDDLVIFKIDPKCEEVSSDAIFRAITPGKIILVELNELDSNINVGIKQVALGIQKAIQARLVAGARDSFLLLFGSVGATRGLFGSVGDTILAQARSARCILLFNTSADGEQRNEGGLLENTGVQIFFEQPPYRARLLCEHIVAPLRFLWLRRAIGMRQEGPLDPCLLTNLGVGRAIIVKFGTYLGKITARRLPEKKGSCDD